jgi:hypothetical protein
MNQFLDWIFGFEAGTFGRPGTGIGFANHVPVWVVLCALLVLGVLVWLSYKGLAGRAWTRFMLGSMRVLLLGLLIVLALGPQIERHRELVEPDRVIMLLDVSGSMNTPEILVDGSRATRASQLNELLESNTEIIDQINSDSTIDLYAFSDRLQSSEVFSVDLSSVQDRAGTTLGGSMQRAINNAGTSPISGIVVFSDGRSHDEVPGALIESLISSGVPVISVPIGSVEPVRDASIGIIESPQAVFAEDRVPVRVQVNSDGYRDGEELTVELLDQATGRTLDTTTIVVGENENTNGNEGNFSSADLSHQFADARNKRMLVRIRPSDQTQDLIEENNQQAIELSVVSEPMRVLYIDGHPRWEYRYLKNLLMREQTIDATTMLIASDRRFIEEGQPINGPIPDTLEAWEPFDVVVLGDIRSDLFSESQLSTLKEHIETKGCGLLWIAGEGSTPSSWSSSELSSLLPYVSGKSDSISNQSQQDSPSVMSLTSEAVRIGMLVSDEGDLSEVSDPSTGWSILRWTHTISDEDLKPGISVLARGDNLENGESRALVTSMRYGSGQVGYVGTDEIWRWRYGRGEDLPEQFWLPMIRTLARGTIARRAAPASLVIAPEQISPGDDVRISLELFDSAVLEGLPEQIDARIRPMSTSGSEINIQLNGNTNRRSGLWTPNEPGMYTLSTQHPLIGSEPISRVLRVHASWDESVNPNTNHAYLESLSQRTDGQVLQNDELAELPDLLPNRTRITTLPPETTAMWDRPIVLILLVLLLSVEWIGRRILRLA